MFHQEFCEYYQTFKSSSCWNKTTKKDKKAQQKPKKDTCVWIEHQQEIFETLQGNLIQAPILIYADYRPPFKLYTDVSSTGLEAELYQCNGQVRIVSYASRCLHEAFQKSYPA